MKNDNIISVSEIINECKRKFVVIIACAVIFAILFGGAKYYLDTAAVNISVKEDGETVAPPIDVYEESELAEIEKYVDFVKKHQSMKKYMEESIYMNLDFTRIYSSNIQVMIKTETEQENIDVLYYLNNYIKLGGLVEDISDFYSNLDAAYLQEIIGFKSMLENTKDSNSNVFTVMVYGRSLEEADGIVTQIEKQLVNVGANNNYLNFKLEIVEKNTGIINSLDVCDNQTKYKSKLTELATKMQTMKDQLSEQQLLTASAMIEVEEKEDKTDINSSVVVGIDKTFVILGGVLGAFAGICLIYVLYYFDNTLKSEQEITDKYMLGCIGSVTESLDFIGAKVSALCNKQKLNDVVFIVPKGVDRALVKSHFEKGFEKSTRVSVVGDILEDIEAVIELSKNENVVLICKIRNTSYAEMNSMLQICEMQNANVLGYIAVK